MVVLDSINVALNNESRSPISLDYVRFILNHSTIEVPNKGNRFFVARFCGGTGLLSL